MSAHSLFRGLTVAALFAGAGVLGISKGWLAPAADHQTAAPVQSASGKVSAVMNDTFSIEIQASPDKKQTLQFSTDGDTKVQTHLKVGELVRVEYKTDSTGKRIATLVSAQKH
jgi:hypothetical protein